MAARSRAGEGPAAAGTAPNRWVALLRGINVGGAARVPMAELREVIGELGHLEVKTLIASGNILFNSVDLTTEQELAAQLTTAISARFGFSIAVLVRSEERVRAVLAALPDDWVNDDVLKCDAIFPFDEVAAPQELKLLARPGIDEYIHADGAVLWKVQRRDQTRSGLLAIMGTPTYRQVTVRNVNTLRRLGQLL